MLVGIYARYTTCWCREVYMYVDIPLGPMGLRVCSPKPPLQQVVYLAYTSPRL